MEPTRRMPHNRPRRTRAVGGPKAKRLYADPPGDYGHSVRLLSRSAVTPYVTYVFRNCTWGKSTSKSTFHGIERCSSLIIVQRLKSQRQT